jgi:hypothetical protein
MPKYTMSERCGQAEVRENNLIVAIEQVIRCLKEHDESAALALLKAALKANKKEQQLS